MGKQKLIDYTREIATVKILSQGQDLLKLDPKEVSITQEERQVLEKISKASEKIINKITSLEASKRDEIIKVLIDKGLIEAEEKIKKTKAEVWLTERGIEYLRDDYVAEGAGNISLDLLGNYLRFMRKTLCGHSQQLSTPIDNVEPLVQKDTNINDEEIL